jgi:hypothetical protein
MTTWKLLKMSVSVCFYNSDLWKRVIDFVFASMTISVGPRPSCRLPFAVVVIM